MQVEIEVFENFFQKQRFNNEIYTRLTCLKDIFCYQLANHYAQFDNCIAGVANLSWQTAIFPCP